jgi:hypothetical protein
MSLGRKDHRHPVMERRDQTVVGTGTHHLALRLTPALPQPREGERRLVLAHRNEGRHLPLTLMHRIEEA